MFKDRRKNSFSGYRTLYHIPAKILKGDETTLAGDRLFLLDFRGEISSDELAEFYIEYIKPNLSKWLAELDNGREKAITELLSSNGIKAEA